MRANRIISTVALNPFLIDAQSYWASCYYRVSWGDWQGGAELPEYDGLLRLQLGEFFQHLRQRPSYIVRRPHFKAPYLQRFQHLLHVVDPAHDSFVLAKFKLQIVNDTVLFLAGFNFRQPGKRI